MSSIVKICNSTIKCTRGQSFSLKRPDCGRFGTNLKSSGVGISTFPSPGRTTKDVVYSWSPYQGFFRDDGTYTIAGVSMQDIVNGHTINYGTGCYPFPTQLGRRTDGNKAETVPLPNMCVSMHAAQSINPVSYVLLCSTPSPRSPHHQNHHITRVFTSRCFEISFLFQM